MRFSYRGAVALLKMMLLPCGLPKSIHKEWTMEIRKFCKNPKLTLKQRTHLKTLLAEVRRRAARHKTIYPAGTYTNERVPASRGRRVKLMPFGTWYYKPTRST